MAGRLSDFRKRGCRFIRFHPMKNSTPELLQLLTPDFACIAHKSSKIYERCRLPDTIGPKIIIAFSTRFSR
jgi:hypothetical protein